MVKKTSMFRKGYLVDALLTSVIVAIVFAGLFVYFSSVNNTNQATDIATKLQTMESAWVAYIQNGKAINLNNYTDQLSKLMIAGKKPTAILQFDDTTGGDLFASNHNLLSWNSLWTKFANGNVNLVIASKDDVFGDTTAIETNDASSITYPTEDTDSIAQRGMEWTNTYFVGTKDANWTTFKKMAEDAPATFKYIDGFTIDTNGDGSTADSGSALQVIK